MTGWDLPGIAILLLVVAVLVIGRLLIGPDHV